MSEPNDNLTLLRLLHQCAHKSICPTNTRGKEDYLCYYIKKAH